MNASLSAFKNKLIKNKKQISAYVKQQQLMCYRVFDWDMPECPLCVDVYDQYAYVSLYKTSFNFREEELLLWMNNIKQTIMDVFQMNEEHIIIKNRQRHISSQYEKLTDTKKEIIVMENGFRFLINLSDYLDTGLFLDHRITRKRVFTEAKNKRVLNLFSYTGSFSVYATMGGATEVTTIDLSNTYLQWAKTNFKLNNLDISKHIFLKTDVKHWLQEYKGKPYDLVILDPPTLSKSTMSKTSFNVQDDHEELINAVLKLMTEGGVLYFSNNYRGFTMNEKLIQTLQIENITDKTIPADFRNKKIHQCWRIIK